MPALDVITIGRSSVDLYGAQIGGRLEDMASFHKYIGGSPTNIACGTARLGLRAGLITRVGDEHMGRFIRETLAAEGVDTRGVVTDPERLTALVILGIRDQTHFPLIFYRENCADMALCEADIDEALIADTRSVTVTGTHLSNPRTEAAVLKALRLARQHGARTALDIDYRPNLWGLAGHGLGEERFIESAAVTAKLQSTLPLFDLIVGTEEEFHIAGGSTDTIAALRAVRAVSAATLVCQARPDGRRRLHRRHPRQPRRRRARPRLPDRGLQRPRRRRRLHVRPPEGLADRRRLADRPHLRQRLRRARRLPPRLHPRLSVVAGTHLLPRPRRPHPRPAPRRRARTDPLGHQPPARLARAQGVRLRPPRAARNPRRRPRPAPRPHRRLQAPLPPGRPRGRERRPRLRHPLRRPPRPRRALRRRRHRPLDRPPGRAAGLAPAPARDRARLRQRARRVAGRAGGQGARLHPPRRRRRDAGRPGGDPRPPRPRRPRQPAGTAARDHPLQGRAGRRHHHGPDHPAHLRPRHPSRLVEARADDLRRRMGRRLRRDHRQRPALPRHRRARPRGAGGCAEGKLRRRRPP